MTLSELHEAITGMMSAINSGHPKEAIAIGNKEISDRSGHIDSADFFFHLSLAHNLNKQYQQADYCQERAAMCSDFDALMKGDFLRDQALTWIRINKIDGPIVIDLINRARELHANDPNRLAALDMVEGRRYYALGDYEKALQCFNQADEGWDKLAYHMQPYDEQWRRNNCFHRLRAAARVGDYWHVHDAANTIIMDSGEKDKRRKNAAWLILHLPLMGVWLVDRKYR